MKDINKAKSRKSPLFKGENYLNIMTKEQEDATNTLAGIIRDSGFLPITRTEDSRKQLLVIDINVLPSEVKDKSIEETTKEYRELYPNYDFLFINTSRQNMEGNTTNHPPVYVI